MSQSVHSPSSPTHYAKTNNLSNENGEYYKTPSNKHYKSNCKYAFKLNIL